MAIEYRQDLMNPVGIDAPHRPPRRERSGSCRSASAVPPGSSVFPRRPERRPCPPHPGASPEGRLATGRPSSVRPSTDISNMPTTWVAPNRFFMHRSTRKAVIGIALERQNDVDHVLEQLGPCQRPVLGHMANQNSRHLALLGEPDEPRGALPNLGGPSGGTVALATRTRSGWSRPRASRGASRRPRRAPGRDRHRPAAST